jgi:hypothetical protein
VFSAHNKLSYRHLQIKVKKGIKGYIQLRNIFAKDRSAPV